MDSRLVTAIEVVVGVPAVLVGYIWLTERLVTLRPAALAAAAPAVAVAGARRSRSSASSWSTRRYGTIIRSFAEQERAAAEVRRPRQLQVVLHQRRRARRPAQQRAVAGAADRVHGRHRAAHRGARRPGRATRPGRRASSSCRWRSAWSRPASSGSSCTTTRPPARAADRHAERACWGSFGLGPVAWLQSPSLRLSTRSR